MQFIKRSFGYLTFIVYNSAWPNKRAFTDIYFTIGLNYIKVSLFANHMKSNPNAPNPIVLTYSRVHVYSVCTLIRKLCILLLRIAHKPSIFSDQPWQPPLSCITLKIGSIILIKPSIMSNEGSLPCRKWIFWRWRKPCQKTITNVIFRASFFLASQDHRIQFKRINEVEAKPVSICFSLLSYSSNITVFENL